MKIKISIAMLIIINLILLIKLISYKYTKDITNNLTSTLKASLYDSYMTNGKKIPVNINFTNLVDNEIDIKTVLENKRSIILVYSDIACNACIDSLLAGCKSLKKQVK